MKKFRLMENSECPWCGFRLGLGVRFAFEEIDVNPRGQTVFEAKCDCCGGDVRLAVEIVVRHRQRSVVEPIFENPRCLIHIDWGNQDTVVAVGEGTTLGELCRIDPDRGELHGSNWQDHVPHDSACRPLDPSMLASALPSDGVHLRRVFIWSKESNDAAGGPDSGFESDARQRRLSRYLPRAKRPTLATYEREIELLRAVVEELGKVNDGEFGEFEVPTAVSRLAAIDKELGR